MAYSYYCTHCGRELDQDHVLMDMYPIITSDADSKLSILKFRLTMQEFMALYNGGTDAGGGFRRCELSLAQLLGYVSNKNNLDDPAIATLTRQELKDYLGDSDLSADAAPAPEKQEKSREAAIFSLLDDSDSGEDDPFFTGQSSAPAQAETVKLAERQIPAAIGAILSTGNKSVDDIVFAQKRLREELECLYNLFRVRDSVPFKLHLYEEQDDKGRKVLTAYRMITIPGNNQFKVEARVCPHCDTPIFDYAGTAKHQSIAFIGYQGSGKTSAILALTHYAENAVLGALDGKIWGNDPGIDTVAQISVVGKSSRLKYDLSNYPKGIAPSKTLASKRTDAYSATLRIRNKSGKWHLLTLVDLPGELCIVPGAGNNELKTRIDTQKVLNEFQIALSADAYVVCFDTSIIAGNDNVVSDIQNVCTWADEFQNLRANDKNNSLGEGSLSVPMMVLFTKCVDLEGDKPVLAPENKKYVQPVEKVYLFTAEKQIIQERRVYNRVMEQFGTFGRLNLAYHAVLRSSPFGYKAPSETDLVRRPENQPQIPSPRNIDKLMRWLLTVSGCIPVEASYQKINETSTPFTTPENYYIKPPQSRIRNPIDDDEALARCALFENPGHFDRLRVNRLGESAIMKLATRFWKANTNAREEKHG